MTACAWKKQPGPEAERIAREIAANYGVTMDDLRSPKTARRYSNPRQAVMHALYETDRYSLPGIGRFLGDRDHTTVLFGVRAHKRRAGL